MLDYQITLVFVIYRLTNTLNDWKTAMFAWARCDPEQPGSQLYKEDDGDVYGVHAKSCKGILIISCRGCTCNTYHNIQPQGEGVRITGYVDYGPGLNGNQEASKSTGIHLTSSVLQFIFLSYIGFWFPSSYMLGSGFIAGQLTSLFWDIINTLSSCHFTIDSTLFVWMEQL